MCVNARGFDFSPIRVGIQNRANNPLHIFGTPHITANPLQLSSESLQWSGRTTVAAGLPVSLPRAYGIQCLTNFIPGLLHFTVLILRAQ